MSDTGDSGSMDGDEQPTEPPGDERDTPDEPLAAVTAYIREGDDEDDYAAELADILTAKPEVVEAEVFHDEGGVRVFTDTFECPECGATMQVADFMHRTAREYDTSTIRCECPDGDESVPMRRVE